MSATQVQRIFRTQYHKEPPSRPTIYSWHKNVVETRCSVCHAKSCGRACFSDATVEQLKESFIQRPPGSTWRASQETGIPNVTVWQVNTLRMRIRWFVRNSVCTHFVGSRWREISGLHNFQWWENISYTWWGEYPQLQDLGQWKSTCLPGTCPKVNVFCAISKECTASSSWRRPLPISCIWTCFNSSRSTVRLSWRRRTHSLQARQCTPSLPWRSVRVPQHLFPRSVDW
jgi:hypothetical protein